MPEPTVIFPKIRVRSPYIINDTVTPDIQEAIRQLLIGDGLILSSSSVDATVWMVNSGVRIHGESRSCLVADARRTVGVTKQTRSGFRLDSKRVGRVISFLTVDVNVGNQTALQFQLALAKVWTVHRDDISQLDIVTLSDVSVEFLLADKLGELIAFVPTHNRDPNLKVVMSTCVR